MQDKVRWCWRCLQLWSSALRPPVSLQIFLGLDRAACVCSGVSRWQRNSSGVFFIFRQEVLRQSGRGENAALLPFAHFLCQELSRSPPHHQGLHGAGQVQQAEQDGGGGHCQHEAEHQGFLCGPGDVTLHTGGAGSLVAEDAPRDGPTKEEKLSSAKHHLQENPHDHHLEIGAVEALPPQWRALEVLERSLVQGDFPGGAGVLLDEGRTATDPVVVGESRTGPRQESVGHVGGEEEVGKEEEQQVEEPEAEDGDRGEGVEADVGAAWLDGVADESVLLIAEEGKSSE